MSHDADVVVLGGGPVGLATAKLLADEQIRVAIIDARTIAIHHMRGSHIDDETVRAMQAVGAGGLEPRFLHHDAGGYCIYDAHGRVVMDLPWRQRTEQGWYGDYQFFQPDFENFLRGRLHEAPTATLWFGWRAVAIEQDRDGVTVRVRHTGSGQERTLSAAYLVGCDGAHSMTREVIGGGIEDFHATHRSLIVDVAAFAPSPAVRKDYGFTRAVAPNPVTCIPSTHGITRFEFLLSPQDDAASFETPTRWYELLRPFYPPGGYRIERADVYSWNAWVPTRWRAGRVFLAGDAAHEMPPHLGQGMCSGLRDALNLAWKLALCIRGHAPDALLDTYQSERRPHACGYAAGSAAAANAVAWLSANPGNPDDPIPPAQLPIPEPRLGPGLHGDAPAPAGVLSIQPTLADGTLLDDAVGYNFAVIGDPAVLAGVDPATARTWRDLGAVVLSEYPPALQAWLVERGARAQIVRPDRYLLGVAEDAAALDRLTELANFAAHPAVTASAS